MTSHLDGLNHHYSTSDPALDNVLGKAGEDASSTWTPETHTGDLAGILGSWLHSGPAPAFAATSEVNQQFEEFFVSFSLCLSAFQVNKLQLFKKELLQIKTMTPFLKWQSI